MKKKYSELIETLCNFHTVALIDRKKSKTSRWIITLDCICKLLYDMDYATFLNNFAVNKPVIMPGVLEAHYNLINALIDYNKDLTSIKVHQEMYECANEVKFIFDDFLYINKYRIHRTSGINKGYIWYNIVPVL